jgi:hypothetical protein
MDELTPYAQAFQRAPNQKKRDSVQQALLDHFGSETIAALCI